MTREDLEIRLRDYVTNEMSDSYLFDDWSEFCDKNHYEEDRIWDMGGLSEIVGDYNQYSPNERLERIRDDFSGFNFNAQYCYYNRNGNISSTDDLLEVIDINQLVNEYIDGNIRSSDSDINDLIEDYEEDNEEE